LLKTWLLHSADQILLRAAFFAVAGLGAVCGGPAVAQQPPQNTASHARPPADPNEKICEDLTVVGSRLATKRICATRAEWEAQKRSDKDTVNQLQTQLCETAKPDCK
jgi:hypothetical protein